jgi:hypothetical protein
LGGNYLNWASMQTLDVFRWVLTGGYRTTDEVGQTILTKTYADKAGSGPKAPDKTVTSGLSGATPFNWPSATTSIKNRGIALLISGTNIVTAQHPNWPSYGCSKGSICLASNEATDYQGQNSYASSSSEAYADPSVVYRLYVNVQVCSASSVGVESNCVAYGSDYKPEGLIQNYSSRLRFAAFGYLNESTGKRDGGVLRAPMKVGYAAGSRSAPVGNSAAEWDRAQGSCCQSRQRWPADRVGHWCEDLAQGSRTIFKFDLPPGQFALQIVRSVGGLLLSAALLPRRRPGWSLRQHVDASTDERSSGPTVSRSRRPGAARSPIPARRTSFSVSVMSTATAMAICLEVRCGPAVWSHPRLWR